MSTVEKVIVEASINAYPVMNCICEKLDIQFPQIKWYNRLITTDNQEIVGAVNEDNLICLNKNKVKEIIDHKDIVDRIMFALYHEFKHYIDTVALNITNQQYLANRNKYEELANKYAKTLLGWGDLK